MPVFLNILPHVFWCYNDVASPKSKPDFNIDKRKFIEYNNITNIIELDTILDFWGKSTNYINEIKVQLQKEEYGKLLNIYKKLNDTIKNSYLNNTPTMITTYDTKYTEIGIGLWLYYFNISGGLTFDNVLKIMALKFIGHIQLTDNIKRFFLLITANSNNK